MGDTDSTTVLPWVRTATAVSALLAVVSHYVNVGGLGGLTGELIAVTGIGITILLYAWGRDGGPRRDSASTDEKARASRGT